MQSQKNQLNVQIKAKMHLHSKAASFLTLWQEMGSNSEKGKNKADDV